MNEKKQKKTALWLCTTAMFMAMNIALSSFGVPVPGGHLYLNDVVICLAAIILDPLAAFMVGGVGAFLGDLFFLSHPNVCVACDTRTSGSCNFIDFAQSVKKTSRFGFGNRCDTGRCNYGSRLFTRQSFYLQYS